MNDLEVVEQRLRSALHAFADRPVERVQGAGLSLAPAPPGRRRGPVVGVVAAVVLLSTAGVLLAYGPRSSNPGSGVRVSTPTGTAGKGLSSFRVTYAPASPTSAAVLQKAGQVLRSRLVGLGDRRVTVTFGGGVVAVSGEAKASDVASQLRLVAERDWVTVRPVECEALAYGPSSISSSGEPGSPLPVCGAPYLMTESTLGIRPLPTAPGGYEQATVTPDPAFTGYPSTSPAQVDADPGATVLVPRIPGPGPARFVLGPSGLDSTEIAGASAEHRAGEWLLDVELTASGSARWDVMAHRSFHHMVAFVLDGTVVSTSVIEPSQSSFSSFDGTLQLGGSFTASQARYLARVFERGPLPVSLTRTSETVTGPGLTGAGRVG
jgi:hypothetical protein